MNKGEDLKQLLDKRDVIDGKKPEEYWADEVDIEIIEESNNERTGLSK